MRLSARYSVRSPVEQLAKKYGLKLPAMIAAHKRSVDVRKRLEKILGKSAAPENCSVVICGSVARCEKTTGSDLDWMLLVDGSVSTSHREDAHQIQQAINRLRKKLKLKEPNAGGAFGSMFFSHELIHAIGGGRDTNANTTHRLLLLIESYAILNPHVRARVVAAILTRYLDPEVYAYKTGNQHEYFPRFLMNDVVRFWRTMAVDYTAKVIERDRIEWAIRNAKLKFSRKLLFVAGMLLAYAAVLDEPPKVRGKGEPFLGLVSRIQSLTQWTPLELLARAILQRPWRGQRAAAIAIFKSYDAFLALIEDKRGRKQLQNLKLSDASTNPTFAKVRKLGERFEEGLNQFFWDGPPEIQKLTRKYALF